MADCFQLLPQWAKDKLVPEPGRKEWMQCYNCRVYKDIAALKKCGGCSEYRQPPIYYCGKQCQKAHWPSHKADCKIIQERGHSYPDDPHKLHLAMLIHRWQVTNGELLVWIIGQAFYCNPSMDPTKVLLEMELDRTSFQLISFRFVAKLDSEYIGFFSQSHFDRLHGKEYHWFCLTINDRTAGPGNSACIILPKLYTARELATIANDREGPFLEWPWIPAHLTRVVENSKLIMGKKWNLLMTATYLQRINPRSSLDRFRAPELQLAVPFFPKDMDVWYQKLNDPFIWGILVKAGHVKKVLDANELSNGNLLRGPL
ncbi:hypothetical protein M408DRAFT_312191 [Serendipita vermifera MAFF 305830]|uniref:MYND-type domain-containing protein n=1 Tax=Serendipita vermifera MAFF 305830 TaxID=933852 RepID=A0A0C3B3R4_SERVB|nr:hypothetical protein M408DRAFT_312191 [Serendipita vermifera MAFF 305830]